MGDEKALEELIRRHLKSVFHFAYRYTRLAADAEDITQDVFLKVWKHLGRFHLEKNFKVWLLAITRNTALDFLKKRKPLVFSDFESEAGENVLAQTIEDPAPLPHALLMQREFHEEFRELLGTLSADHQTVLLLHYEDELTFQEIAEVLGKPMNTIKSAHRRALLALRKKI